MTFRCPDSFRIRKGEWATASGDAFGAFFVPCELGRPPLKIIATDGHNEEGLAEWEHVSISLPDRCPTWEEMAYVKALFWSEEDCVLQFHPPRGEYVNNHPFCLHLWRPVGIAVPMPPSILVGYKSIGDIT